MTPYRFTTAPTPVGVALLAFSDDGLVSLHLGDGDPEWALEALSHELGAVPAHDPAAGDDVARQLDEYFDGERTEFDIALDWRLARGFHLAALQAVLEIPYGETASYGEVAIAAGRPRAARAVGTACRATPFSLVVPVHRVVRADGSIGEYGARPEVKRFLIEHEHAMRPHATEGLPR